MDLRTGWPDPSETDVVVCLGDPPTHAAAELPLVIDLPRVIAEGASPDAIAEYLLSRARAALSEWALAQYRRDQFEMTRQVAHDLKNSVMVVQANFAFVRGVVPSEDDLDEAIEDANDAARSMDRALSDLEMMTTLELGIQTVAREVVWLGPIAEGTRTTWARPLKNRRLTVDVQLSPELSAIGQTSMLQRVFDNIIGARIRCARDGAIEVRGAIEGSSAVVYIADHGLFVAPEDRARVFDKAGPGLNLSRKIGNLCVGLYLARLIVEAHGGEIAVVDLPGFSSCFRVALPAGLRASITPLERR